MKHILSVSLGSSKRNHSVETELLGEKFLIERIGTDGDKEKAIELIKQYDGKVSAFGMGGIDIYVGLGKKRYVLRDAIPLKNAAAASPIVDGVGLKNTLEREVIKKLWETRPEIFKGKSVIVTSAVDRFGMAESLKSLPVNLVYGDIVCILGIPRVLKSYKMLYNIVSVIAPIIVKMPFEWLYPTGEKQEKIGEHKHAKILAKYDIIAGDFLFINKMMPEDLTDKTIITNTVTKENIEELKSRGLKRLITTTPEFNGRSFGTNVMEALLVSIIDKPLEQITEGDYLNMLKKLEFEPRIEELN